MIKAHGCQIHQDIMSPWQKSKGQIPRMSHPHLITTTLLKRPPSGDVGQVPNTTDSSVAKGLDAIRLRQRYHAQLLAEQRQLVGAY